MWWRIALLTGLIAVNVGLYVWMRRQGDAP